MTNDAIRPSSEDNSSKDSLPQAPFDLFEEAGPSYAGEVGDSSRGGTGRSGETEQPSEKTSAGSSQPNPPARFLNWFVERRGNIFALLFLAVVLVAAVFHVGNGKPLFPISVAPTSVQPPAGISQAPALAKSTFVILGQYDGQIYTFNSGVDKIFAYNLGPSNPHEHEIVSVPEFEKFLWHEQGRLLLVSRAENALGNIYLVDFTQSDPELELPTRREGAPNFPSKLRVDESSELSWSHNGEAIAFTAHDTESGKSSLFIYEIGHPQLIYTPARNMDSISSLLWVTNTLAVTTDILSFVAISDGQEGRYFVDRSGGRFTKWTIK